MPLFEADEQTEGIVIYTEPGGRMEAELARWVTENDSRLPIVAFMAGRFMDEMPGMSFGHAGTIVEGKEDTATEKIARLAEAGITVAEDIARSRRSCGRRWKPRGGDPLMHLFIDVEVDADVAADPGVAARLAEVCPVDIFAVVREHTLEIVEENLDECVLCELCIDAAPQGTVRVRKLTKRRVRASRHRPFSRPWTSPRGSPCLARLHPCVPSRNAELCL
jgi:NAD-dependent dihydropyrimidine dehydrogenase PreA subunit